MTDDKVTQLDGSNYSTWKFAIKMLLKEKRLWYCIEYSTERDEKQFQADDQVALAKIALSLKPELYQTISGCKTSKEAWDQLENIYQCANLNNLLMLITKLLTTKPNDGEKMNVYFLKMKETYDQIKEIQAKEKSLSDIGSIFLNALAIKNLRKNTKP